MLLLLAAFGFFHMATDNLKAIRVLDMLDPYWHVRQLAADHTGDVCTDQASIATLPVQADRGHPAVCGVKARRLSVLLAGTGQMPQDSVW
jgi:hypothetical protein